jgi:hypothetical protein
VDRREADDPGMDEPMDVMLIENRPHAGDETAAALEAAGHRVHRCHDPSQTAAFPCTGALDPDECPLSHEVEVAMLVRHGISPRPTALENGVNCALRHGIPIVEDGPAMLDPYESWISGRTDGNPEQACREAIARAREPFLAELAEETGTPGWRIERTGDRLHLIGSGPALDPASKSRLAVRALDVARRRGWHRERVDVSYETLPSETLS